MIHNTAVGIDALAMAPVRPAGPARAVLRVRGRSQPGLPTERGAGMLGHQQSLGDGVRAEIAFLLHMRPHGV